MKREQMQKVIQNGGEKTTSLACYFIDQKSIFENGRYVESEWRNPTVKEFIGLNIDRRLVYNAAKIADVKIKKGKILICAEKKSL